MSATPKIGMPVVGFGMGQASAGTANLNKAFTNLKAKVEAFDQNDLKATDITQVKTELSETLAKMMQEKPIIRRTFGVALEEIPSLIERCEVLLATAPQPETSSSAPSAEPAQVQETSGTTEVRGSRLHRKSMNTRKITDAASRQLHTKAMQDKRAQNARIPVIETPALPAVVTSSPAPKARTPERIITQAVKMMPVTHSTSSPTPRPSSVFANADIGEWLAGVEGISPIATPVITSSSSSSTQPSAEPAQMPSSSSEVSSSQSSDVHTAIVIKYPVQLGKQLYVFGEGNERLSWKTGLPLIAVDSQTWTLETPLAGSYKYKLKMNDSWEKGGNKTVSGSDPVTFAPIFSSTPQKATPKLTRVTMLYDAKPGTSLEIYGTGPGMTWKQGLPVRHMGGNVWVWETDKASAKFEYKIVAKRSDGKTIWEGGKNRQFTPGKFEVLNPRL